MSTVPAAVSVPVQNVSSQTVSAAGSHIPLAAGSRSTIHLPALHLGSFNTLSPGTFKGQSQGQPTSPVRSSPVSPLAQPSSLPRSSSSLSSSSSLHGSASLPQRRRTSDQRDDDQPRQTQNAQQQNASGSLSSPRRREQPTALHLTAPTSSMLGSLPLFSPISPLKPPSPSDFDPSPFETQSRDHTRPSWSPLNVPSGPRPFRANSPNLSVNANASASTVSRNLSDRGGGSANSSGVASRVSRPLTPSLTVHTSSPLSPERNSKQDSASPRLRDSPGMPRRRTIIEASPVKHPSPVRVAGGYLPPHPQQLSPSPILSQLPPVESFQLPKPSAPSLMPFPQPSLAPSETADVRNDDDEEEDVDEEGNSPPSRRTLPRPQTANGSIRDTISMPVPNISRQSTVVPGLGLTAEPQPLSYETRSVRYEPQPSPSRSREMSRQNTWQRPAIEVPSQREADLPEPAMFPRGHQSSKSASTLPAIAGLADAGPYPTASPLLSGSRGILDLPGVPNAAGLGAGGVGMGKGLGLGRPSMDAPRYPTEEVCLECMMRDRDLADVDVQGEGTWARESDAGWDELKDREYDILHAMSADYGSAFSLEDSSSEESASISSPRSGASYLSDGGARRTAVARRQRSEVRKARVEVRDAQIARVGWRKFAWETTLPRGFRGTKGGPLTEDGIKHVLAQFPSSSQLRYTNLHQYVADQWRLVKRIRAEAERLGYYPLPNEPRVSRPSQDVLSGSLGAYQSRETNDRQRNTMHAPRSLPSQALRPSPSTPTALSLAPAPVITSRPRTQFIPDREPAPSGSGVNNSPVSRTPRMGTPTRPRHGKGASSPGVLERSPRFGEEWSDSEDLWQPSSPPDGSLRPFSFAVRAGAAAAARGEGGESISNRRSFFGRFGGSVTSLFGGSHGGSGSMMDMHLGLDDDRRNAAGNEYPRAVSMASPSRPSFFQRESRGGSSSSIAVSAPGTGALVGNGGSTAPMAIEARSRSISASRLGQMSFSEDDQDRKKKGFKGFFAKMKPKRNKGGRDEGGLTVPSPRPDDDAVSSDLGAPLAPPPPISFLVNRGDREHGRKRSGSSISMLTDSQASISITGGGGSSPQMGYANIPFGLRSVSAPNGSSISSQSVSPTSSRFAAGPGPDNHSSTRRRSDGVGEIPEAGNSGTGASGSGNGASGAGNGGYERGERGERGSGLEMLSTGPGARVLGAPEAPIYDEPRGLGYPTMAYRATLPSLSYSTSSGTMAAIDTPDLALGPTFVTPAPTQVSTPTQQGGSTSPNRYKNLPPLPPPEELRDARDTPVSTSPYTDTYSDAYDDGYSSMPPPRTSSMHPDGSPQSVSTPFSRGGPGGGNTGNASGSTNRSINGIGNGEHYSSRYHPNGTPLSQTQTQPSHPQSQSRQMSSPSSSISSPNQLSWRYPHPQQQMRPNSPSHVPLHAPRQPQMPQSLQKQSQAPPRASFDPLGDRPARARQQRGDESPSPRLAQSMYIQPTTVTGSTGSFSRFLTRDGPRTKTPMQGQAGYDGQQEVYGAPEYYGVAQGYGGPPGYAGEGGQEEKSTRGKRGFKAIFSKAR